VSVVASGPGRFPESDAVLPWTAGVLQVSEVDVSRITEEIEVGVPVRVAYDQWTQFESFPHFMSGVDRVVRLDDKTLEWTATIAGVTKHWRAEILEQRPDEVVAWRSTEGARTDGQIRFRSLGADRTMVELQLDVEPDNVAEKAADALGVVERRVRGDLEKFREFIESRAQPTGGWRGRVEGGRVEDDDDAESGATSGTVDREQTRVGRTG
jgi:uncharacterized membrane protein